MEKSGIGVLLAFLSGFLLAQLAKLVIYLVLCLRGRQKYVARDALGCLLRSGGMPSGHTASMVAATTYIGLINGFGSSIFALSAVVTLIVLYDATHVRYAVGVQGIALNKLLRRADEKPLKIVEGHTPAQVMVGLVIGIGVGLLMYLLVG